MRFGVIPSFARSDSLQAEKDEDQAADEQDGQRATQLQHVADDRAIFAGGGIVVIAVQKNLIDRVADFSLRGFDQSHTQIFRWEVDAVEIARDADLRSEKRGSGGVWVVVFGC